MMDSSVAHYFAEKLAGAPRDLALAVAFVPPARRDLAVALQVLRLELETLVTGSRDPDVLVPRVGWWREEWARLVAGEPRHPVTRALGACGLAFEADRLDVPLAAVLRSAGDEAGTLAAQLDPIEAAGAALGAIEAVALGAAVQGSPASAPPGGSLARRQRTWQALGRVEWLLGLEQRLAAGRQALPLDLAASLQLTRREVLTEPSAARRFLAAAHGRLAKGASAGAPAPGSDAFVYARLRQLRLERRLRGAPEPGAARCLWRTWQATRALRAVREAPSVA